MHAESSAVASFFDDDDLGIRFEFTKPEKSHLKQFNSLPLIKGPLSRYSSNSDNYDKGLYAIYSKFLAFYESSSAKSPQFVLDLSYSRVSVHISNEDQNHHFILAKNGNSFKFYSNERTNIENWANALKNICILTNFHEEYKALKMIGKGSFAKVYLVESKISKKHFAVKAFTKEGLIISNKGNAKPAMLNEIDIMRTANHENIVRLHEVFETEKSIYLVLELIQGKSLQELLKKNVFKEPNSESRIPNIIRSILNALAFLASKGIMHRDLKPDNILLDKEDKVKIVDFGLATFINVDEYIFKKCGTPGYIAPEVFKYDQKNPSTNYDGHCDVFSIGGILFYMYFGVPFFEGSNASEILKINRKFLAESNQINMIKQEIQDPMSKIPKDGLSFLLQLLEFDHKKRPSAAQALVNPFLSAFSDFGHKIPSLRENSENLSRGGSLSPTILSPLKRIATSTTREKLSPLISERGRFVKKDSLYLDIKRPDTNNKLSGNISANAQNSMFFRGSDLGNSISGSTSDSLSPIRKANYFEYKRPGTKSFKGHILTGNNQPFLKHSFSSHLPKSNEEESKYEGGPLLKLEQIKHELAHQNSEMGTASTTISSADKYRGGSQSPIYHRINSIISEESPFKLKIEQIPPHSIVPLNVNRLSQISGRKFQSVTYKH